MNKLHSVVLTRGAPHSPDDGRVQLEQLFSDSASEGAMFDTRVGQVGSEFDSLLAASNLNILVDAAARPSIAAGLTTTPAELGSALAGLATLLNASPLPGLRDAALIVSHVRALQQQVTTCKALLIPG